MAMTLSSITRMEDVREGDIFLGNIPGLGGAIVRLGELMVDGGFRVGPLDVRHIAIVTGADPRTGEFRLTQAMPGGAETVTMTHEQHWTPKCAYARPFEDYPGQARDAARLARMMVLRGVGYSWASYAALAAWRWGWKTARLEQWIDRRQATFWFRQTNGQERYLALPVEAICSVLVDQAWSMVGKRVVTGTAHQAVTPSMLAQSLLADPGVVWGFPGHHPYVPTI